MLTCSSSAQPGCLQTLTGPLPSNPRRPDKASRLHPSSAFMASRDRDAGSNGPRAERGPLEVGRDTGGGRKRGDQQQLPSHVVFYSPSPGVGCALLRWKQAFRLHHGFLRTRWSQPKVEEDSVPHICPPGLETMGLREAELLIQGQGMQLPASS